MIRRTLKFIALNIVSIDVNTRRVSCDSYTAKEEYWAFLPSQAHEIQARILLKEGKDDENANLF